MELRDYVRALRRDWLLVLAAVVLAGIGTLVVTRPAGPMYRASTVLFVTYDPGNSDPDVTTQRLQSYVALLKGPGIASAVTSELNLPLTTEEVQQKLDAEVEPGTVLIVLSATDPSPARARAIADSAARHLADRVRELETTRSPATASPVTITVAQAAVTSRASGELPRNLGFALVLGLLIGIAASAARQALFAAVRDEEELRRFTGLEPLGLVRARAGQIPCGLLETFRKLRAALPPRLAGARATAESYSLLVTSCARGEGTTTVACGLAIALAETGARVVLVDANLRAPAVAANLGMNVTRGLSDVLTGAATIESVKRDWGDDRLQVVAAGPPVTNPGELVASPMLAQTIRTLERAFDVVLVDAPAVLPVADAVVLSGVTSGALLVVRTGDTRVDRLIQAVNLLNGARSQIVGAVLTGLPKRTRAIRPWQRPSAAGPRPTAPATPARPPVDVPPGDSSVVLAIGSIRGRASVIRPVPDPPNGHVPDEGPDDDGKRQHSA